VYYFPGRHHLAGSLKVFDLDLQPSPVLGLTRLHQLVLYGRSYEFFGNPSGVFFLPYILFPSLFQRHSPHLLPFPSVRFSFPSSFRCFTVYDFFVRYSAFCCTRLAVFCPVSFPVVPCWMIFFQLLNSWKSSLSSTNPVLFSCWTVIIPSAFSVVLSVILILWAKFRQVPAAGNFSIFLRLSLEPESLHFYLTVGAPGVPLLD